MMMCGCIHITASNIHIILKQHFNENSFIIAPIFFCFLFFMQWFNCYKIIGFSFYDYCKIMKDSLFILNTTDIQNLSHISFNFLKLFSICFLFVLLNDAHKLTNLKIENNIIFY